MLYKEYPTFAAFETLKYGRKSRFDDPLLSVEEVLERHDKILNEYSEKYLGGHIPPQNEYKEVKSSESIDDRPEMLRLLKAIESPKIRAILVVEVQRLCRGDLEDMGRLIKLLRYTNTYVLTPHKTYDLRDEYDRDAFERELKRGNEYLEYTKKILQRGTLLSVKEGNYVGSVPPYGFDKDIRVNGKKVCHTLKENKAEADIVRMIFNWYCNDDVGTHMICRRLEALGVTTRTGVKRWKDSTIYRILENVHYIGKVRWNFRRTVKIVEDQKVIKKRPKPPVEEYLIFEGRHDAIIPEELFYRAQEIKGTRHRTKTDQTLKNPLSGLVYCKRCGHTCGYNTYRKRKKEFAPAKLVCNDQVHCKSGSADFDEVIKYICNVLQDCIEDYKIQVKENKDDSSKLHEDLVLRLEKKLEELEEREVQQWEDQYKPEVAMPPEIFKRLNEKLLKEKEEVKQALCNAQDSIPSPVDYKDKIVRFTTAVEYLTDPNIPAKITNRYLKDIIDRIEYDRPPAVRIPKDKRHLYPDAEKGQRWYMQPYKITIELK
jgi:hypothetical protein